MRCNPVVERRSEMFQTGRFPPGGSRVLKRISAAEGGVLHLPTHTPGGPLRETNPEERQGPRLAARSRLVRRCLRRRQREQQQHDWRRRWHDGQRRSARAPLLQQRPHAHRRPITIGAEQWPECINPITQCANSSWKLWTTQTPTMAGPWKTTNDGNYEATSLLAEEPTLDNKGITESPFTITFKINPAAVWDDGSPITSADFDFTWRRDHGHRGLGQPSGVRPDRLDRHHRPRDQRSCSSRRTTRRTRTSSTHC